MMKIDKDLIDRMRTVANNEGWLEPTTHAALGGLTVLTGTSFLLKRKRETAKIFEAKQLSEDEINKLEKASKAKSAKKYIYRSFYAEKHCDEVIENLKKQGVPGSCIQKITADLNGKSVPTLQLLRVDGVTQNAIAEATKSFSSGSPVQVSFPGRKPLVQSTLNRGKSLINAPLNGAGKFARCMVKASPYILLGILIVSGAVKGFGSDTVAEWGSYLDAAGFGSKQGFSYDDATVAKGLVYIMASGEYSEADQELFMAFYKNKAGNGKIVAKKFFKELEKIGENVSEEDIKGIIEKAKKDPNAAELLSACGFNITLPQTPTNKGQGTQISPTNYNDY